MEKDKQIEEMAKIIADCEICIYRGDVIWKEEDVSDDLALCIARVLNEQGYRKASDVAREIFEDVESLINLLCLMTGLNTRSFGKYAELKKKYIQSEDK